MFVPLSAAPVRGRHWWFDRDSVLDAFPDTRHIETQIGNSTAGLA